MADQIPEALIKSLKSHYTQSKKNDDMHGVIITALQLLVNPETSFKDPQARKTIYKGLALLYHPDKNQEINAEEFFKLLAVINTDNGIEMLKSIRSQLNPAVPPAKNSDPIPKPAKYTYQQTKQYDPWADFKKKDQEERDKARKEYKEYLEKLRRQQAAAQAAAQAANQNPQYHEYGKEAFFRKARQEHYKQPDQHQNDYINILSKLDKIIDSMQKNFTKMQQSNDTNEQNISYNEICSSYYKAIRDIQSLSQTFINNYPELQKRRDIIEATWLQAYQERLFKKRQAQQPPRQEELPRQQPPRQEELPRQQQPQEPRTKQLLTSEQIALAKVYFAKNPTQTKLSRKTRILDNNGNPVLLPHSIMKSADQKLYALYRGKQAYRNPENKQGFLGQGSFGRVKLAQCLDDGKIVAAKMALINKYQTVDDINKEKAMQEAAGQYLGSTRTNFKYQNKHYIFSEFIEGESLTNVFFMPNTKYLIPKKNISSNDKKGNLEIILATLQATQELHKKGIIHGDLSFNNILYNPETKKATIIDFGRAVKSNQDLIQDPLIRLPYAIPFDPNHYAPPELNGARANYRSDIYSIGKWINWYADATRDPFLQELSRGMLNPDPTKRVNAQMCIDKINTALYKPQNDQRRYW